MLHDSSCLLSLRIDRKEYQIERPGCPPTDTRNLSHLSRANRSERLCCNCCQPFPDSKSPCAKQRNSTCQGRVNLRICKHEETPQLQDCRAREACLRLHPSHYRSLSVDARAQAGRASQKEASKPTWRPTANGHGCA